MESQSTVLTTDTAMLIIAIIAQIIVIVAGYSHLRERITKIETHLIHIMRKLSMDQRADDHDLDGG